jgi:thiaminase (transcriptional activator TenA)
MISALDLPRAFEVPPFPRACLEHAGAAWGASFDHPFVRALVAGTLDPAKFRFYQMQDARYLEAFSDACALLSTRAPDPGDKRWYLEAARLALVVEAELHAGYGRKLGYTPEDIAALELTPNNRAYQDHMVSSVLRGALVEGIATITPCPWLYVDLGQWIQRELGQIDDTHPYAAWLRTYADPGLNDYMTNLLQRLERAAAAADEPARTRAKEAFRTSARYEYMFWEQAFAGQRWPV